jgi:hypothetical protein
LTLQLQCPNILIKVIRSSTLRKHLSKISSKVSINIIVEREIIKNKTKPDKYFLLTTSEHNNVVSSWCDTTEHLLFQLRFLKINYSYTDIENAIQTAFNILNFPRKIGPDKFLSGKLLSKIQNSYIFILTDGGKLSSPSMVFSTTDRISLSYSEKNDLYFEPFRWDQYLIILILGEGEPKATTVLKKYTSIINGETTNVYNYEMLIEKIDQYVFSKCFGNRATIYLDKPGSKKLMLNLNVDFKNYVLSKPIICMDKDDFEKVEHRERWPLPDDFDKFLINKNTKSLPKKKSYSFIYNKLRRN